MKRILYVDDDDDIREIASMALGLDPDLEIRSCNSGPAAISEAARWKPDLILLDVMMPGMDGPETLGKLRSESTTAGIPVVFVTARTQAHDVKRFEALGADGVIPKPFDPMALAIEVQVYLQPAPAG